MDVAPPDSPPVGKEVCTAIYVDHMKARGIYIFLINSKEWHYFVEWVGEFYIETIANALPMAETEQVQFRKGSRVWWNLKLASKKPPWIPKMREDQAAEVMDVDGDTAVIGILNENRKMETLWCQ
jgi:hypothetical protein